MSIFGALALIALAACSGGNPAGPDPLPAEAAGGSQSSAGGEASTVELRYDQTVLHEGLELRLVEIADSRCPTGVQCIWAGEVAVRLEAAEDDGEPVEVELMLPAEQDRDRAEVHGYLLRLLAVEPYPKYGVTTPREGHVVRIEIQPAATP